MTLSSSSRPQQCFKPYKVPQKPPLTISNWKVVSGKGDIRICLPVHCLSVRPDRQPYCHTNATSLPCFTGRQRAVSQLRVVLGNVPSFEFSFGRNMRAYPRSAGSDSRGTSAVNTTVREGHEHRVITPENLGKARETPQNRRALGETPAEPSGRPLQSPLRGQFPRRASLRVVPL